MSYGGIIRKMIVAKEHQDFNVGNIVRVNDVKDVIFLADLHFGNKMFNREKFERIMTKIQDNKKDYWIIILSDLVETALKSIMLEGTIPSEYPINEQVNYVVKWLKPLKQQIIGSLNGNHEARLSKALNAQYSLHKAICDRLEIENLGILRVFQFFNDKEIYTGIAKHKNGSAVIEGSRLTQLLKMKKIIPNLDFYALAHSHCNQEHIEHPIRLNKNYELIQRDSAYFYCGHMLKYGGYALEAGYAPSVNGIRVMRLNPDKYEIILDFLM